MSFLTRPNHITLQTAAGSPSPWVLHIANNKAREFDESTQLLHTN